MAQIVGGIGTSHAPSIAFAWDAGHHDRPGWKPFFEAYQPVRAWLSAQAVDTLIVVYNDHLNNFQFDNYPSFALGTGDVHPLANEGKAPRPLAPVPGHSAFAWALARGLLAEEFDLSLCQEMALDHGILSVLPLVDLPPWKLRVVPLAVNVVLDPMPTPRRCWKLGQSIGRVVRAMPSHERVVVMSSGGLSHQLQGPAFGFTNPQWDALFMDLLEQQPEALSNITHHELIERGGAESVEMMVWLTMRGALGLNTPKRIQRYQDAPMLTGYGLLALECQEQSDA